MKKILAVILMCLLCFSLCSCGGETSGKQEAVVSNSRETTESVKNERTEPAEAVENVDGITADFKSAMDSYEKFMDEYVSFMKKYKANPTDLSLLGDYADYMSKYSEFMEDFEKWEDEEMNAAELAYYLEVQQRVSKKLLEAAQ